MEGTTNHTCDINSKNKTADPVALVNKTGFIYFQPYEVIGFFSRLILQMVKVENIVAKSSLIAILHSSESGLESCSLS